MKTKKPLPLHRKGLLAQDFFGLDSIQGYLEMAAWYDASEGVFVCSKAESETFGSMLHTLEQLQRDGYVELSWLDETINDEHLLKLKQVALTVKGHSLLREIAKETRIAKFRKRTVDLLWVVVTTIVTTIVVIHLNGK